jgi:hypothetical protein
MSRKRAVRTAQLATADGELAWRKRSPSQLLIGQGCFVIVGNIWRSRMDGGCHLGTQSLNGENLVFRGFPTIRSRRWQTRICMAGDSRTSRGGKAPRRKTNVLRDCAKPPSVCATDSRYAQNTIMLEGWQRRRLTCETGVDLMAATVGASNAGKVAPRLAGSAIWC